MCRSIEARGAALLLCLLCVASAWEPAHADADPVFAGVLPATEVERLIGGRPSPARPGRVGYYGLGRTPSPEEIAGWDIDVRPDGAGLPPGSGSVADGERLYEEKCAMCHGTFGEGADRWPPLAGGGGSLASAEPEKTVGSYWQHAATLWDYIRRAMPFFEPQSLKVDEVYALTAYVLYLNDLVAEDFVLTADTLPGIRLPNRDGFFLDPRPDSSNTLCMQNCRDASTLRVTWDATGFGVTPDANARNVAAAAPASGRAVYASACAACHDNGLAGAPRPGDQAEWTKRVARGLDALVVNAINGFSGAVGYMPPKGGQSRLTDSEVRAAVTWMVEQSGSNRKATP